MNNRPKIKLKLTLTDKLFEILGWFSILAIWVVTISNYNNLPESIPIHYNTLGQADGFGSKVIILTLPFIATILFIGLTILNKFPHVFNYPISITADNALRQYTIATRLIRYLKLIIVFIFGQIVLQTIKNVKENTSELGIWMLPLTLGLIFVPIAFYIFKSINKTK